MKRLFLLLMSCCLTSIVVAATEVVDGITWTYSISKGNAIITKADDVNEDVKIPAVLGGYPVTTIGSGTFMLCRIKSITIPTSVTTIMTGAFTFCPSLESVMIPESVQVIETGAFAKCDKLDISVDSKNKNYILHEGALFDKTMTRLLRAPREITTYTIPSSVTTIGAAAFCNNLNSVTIPASVKTIDIGAFEWCSLKNVTLDPQNPNYTVQDGVLFNKDMTLLLYYFKGREVLQREKYKIPLTVTTIGKGAFTSCMRLTSVTIPEGVKSIGSGAFFNCWNLTSITIPKSITSIGDFSFDSCRS